MKSHNETEWPVGRNLSWMSRLLDWSELEFTSWFKFGMSEIELEL